MAYQFSYVTTTDGFAELLFNLKTLLKAAGWTVLSSGDGTTYFAASDGITTGAAGAGGMRNDKAWFRIRQPSGGSAPYAGTREFVFQYSPASFVNEGRAKYSYSAGFTGGAPSATQTPSAADEMFWFGGGTDAAPTYAFFDFNVFAGRKGYVAVNDAAPWNWYVVAAREIPPDAYQGAMCYMMWDAVIQAPFNATDPLLSDREPYVWTFMGAGDNNILTGSSPHACWTYFDVAGSLILVPVATIGWKDYTNTSNPSKPPSAVSVFNPYNGAVDVWPLSYSMQNGNSITNIATNWRTVDVTMKGYSVILDVEGGASEQRDRGTLNTTNDRINFGKCWWPWNGAAV